MIKKLLILGIIPASIFANENKNENESAFMEINVTVMTPLNVEVTEHVDFNNLILEKQQTKEGEFRVTGEPKGTYNILLRDGDSEIKDGVFYLKNTNDQNSTLPVNVDDSITNRRFKLKKNGENKHNLKVAATAHKDQEPGVYKGDLTIGVRYE
nr:hypothetical protein [uncultured Cetobacterium sp.]